MIERMMGVISKRADTRLPYPELNAVVRNRERSQKIELINISSRGLRFKTDAHYYIGDKLWFDIWSNEENPLFSLSIKGYIRNDYTNTDDKVRNYGVQFFRIRYLNERERIHTYVHANKKEMVPSSAPYNEERKTGF